MGTGILALALNQAPFATPILRCVAEGLWFLNIALFALFSLLYAARWLTFPREAARIFSHSVMSMFFGAVPMGLAAIINGFLVFGIARWGEAAVTRQDHSIEKMTAVWLLPIVAAEVTASSAGLLVPYLANSHTALRMVVLGYALWAYSVPLAMSVLVILLLRLVLHKLPHKDMAASGWLALGPIGTGALGLLLLGADSPRAFSAAGIAEVGEIAAGIGVVGGALLWGYGAWWLLLAVLTTIRYPREGMPFNLGWWGFTFPLGVYAVSTLALARQTHREFFAVIGGALTICLALFWIIVAARTLHGAWLGRLFVSPCLVKGAIPTDLGADLV